MTTERERERERSESLLWMVMIVSSFRNLQEVSSYYVNMENLSFVRKGFDEPRMWELRYHG
jgi:hypothetical protein